MNPDNDGPLGGVLAVALVAIVVGGTVDLILDRPERWLSAHVLFEVTMIMGALLLTLALWTGWRRSAVSAERLRTSLAEKEEERRAWQRSAETALDGLGRAIDRQFGSWELTPSEREIALHLLKGYSHKAIAKRTGRSAQTVRQHAAAVYRKGSLSGRAELSAFFLEGLIIPDDDRGASGHGS